MREQSASRRGAGRQRVRDLRSDLPTIVGGLALGGGVLLCFAVLLGLSFLFGVAQTWPAVSWISLGAVGVLLVSLQLLFLRDWLRWRRAMAVAARG